MAGKLVELGVDVLEAWFPIASEGEYEAVTAVSKEFRRRLWQRWPAAAGWTWNVPQRRYRKHAGLASTS
jgi:isopropylmalate/homocitrate/citramalate synthase